MGTVGAFIDTHHLHDCCPVSLGSVSDLYTVQRVPLTPATLGFGLVEGEAVLIAVNAGLTLPEQRAIVCHELAHVLLHHPNSFFLCQLNSWLYDRYEQRAWAAAGRLLICKDRLRRLVYQGATLPELCEEFQAPEGLVKSRLHEVLGL